MYVSGSSFVRLLCDMIVFWVLYYHYYNYYDVSVKYYSVYYDEFGKPKSQIPPVSLLCLSYSSIEGTKKYHA